MIFHPPSSATSTTVEGFTDANWGGDFTDGCGDFTDGCKSTSGSCFSVCGNLVSWSSKKQSTVSISTCEAEYVAMSEATSQGLWISQVLRELQLIPDDSFDLSCDNEASIKAASNPCHHGPMKHINIKYHMVRDYVEQGDVNLMSVSTEHNIADILTKPLPRKKLLYCIS